MPEATYSEIQTDLTSVTLTETESEIESAQQQMVERQPLLSSHQPSDPSSSNYLPQQQIVEDDVTIDIRQMTQDCKDTLLLPKNCCIYRVPVTLRHLNKEAYIPKVVSVGPFHYRNERLQDMERNKKILFKRFTQRASQRLDDLNDLVGLIKGLESDVRSSYSETIKLTKQELVELILVDAGFIIELFINRRKRDGRINAIFSQRWLYNSILRDLILLENQLPFFVIEKLFDKALGDSLPSFRTLAYEYFDRYNHQELKPDAKVTLSHFTDLVRLFYVDKKQPEQEDYSTGEACNICNILSYNARPELEDYSTGEACNICNILSCNAWPELENYSTRRACNILSYNANALHEAGIKLKASKSIRLLDLELSGRNTLEIPKILVDDGTELLFRNMIALEQCHYPYHAYITNYLTVLDCLMDTHKDVDLLIDKNIVGHGFGDSNEVASLFNGLLKNVIQSKVDPKYLNICQNLNGYCKQCWHKKNATLRRDYCHTPWQIVASIAAAVLLFLTVVQTIFSILQVVEK